MNIFFITPDIQTAIGALAVNSKIKVVCIDKSSVIEKLQEQGYSIFSYEQKTGKTILRNSKLLLMQQATKDYINSFEGEKQFIFFKPLIFPSKLLQEYGFPKILNNDAIFSAQIENKLYLKNFKVKTPTEITTPTTFPVVLQFETGYAGNSTFVVHNKNDLQTLIISKNAKYKIVEFIKNIGTYTNNCFCSNEKVFISEPFFQYTGISGLTRTKLGSCGNNFYVDITDDVKDKVKTYSKQIGEHLLTIGYKGVYGIDFVLSDKNELYVIEINPRFTASISFFTQLENLTGNESFFEKQIKNFLDKPVETEYTSKLKGKRLLVRNDTFENREVKSMYKSGIYKIENEKFEFLREEFFVSNLKENEILLFIKDTGFIATPETDIVNLYTLNNISEDTLINALINLKNQII